MQIKDNPIDTAALAWLARLDKGDLSAQEHAEFKSWLDADVRHKGAYFRAKALWQRLDRLQILSDVGEHAPAPPRRISRRRGLLIGGGAALAASVAAIIGTRIDRGHLVTSSNPTEIRTTLGEVSRIPLTDGSLITVNTDSLLKVSIAESLRAISLDRGEAWFQVAKDAERPFVVSTGSVYVKVIGTAFAVRRQDYGADVLVTEGVIETWSHAKEGQRSYVSAGSKVFVSDLAGPSTIVYAGAKLENALAWRNGEIALDGQSLRDAAAEFNRYNARKVSIDPALAQKSVVGLFHINDPEAFARAAAVVSNAVVVESPLEIHLAPKADR